MIGYPLDSHVEFDSDGTPIYDRAISSAPLRKLFKSLFSDGIMPNPSTNLQVSAGEGMNVIVSPGFAMCNGCMKLEEAQRTLAIQASSAAYDRIDTVVLRLNDNDSERICDLYIIQGTPAVSPVRPELTRTESIWELGLADLFIAKNSTAISNQRITDTRYETSRCGIMSSISKFDTETLYLQVQSDLAGFRENEQAAIMAWFEEIKGQLSEDAAVHLFEMIIETSASTIEFESQDTEEPDAYTDVAVLESGETHRSIMKKVSTMFRNVRYIWKMLGQKDISKIGDGTVTGAIGALNDNLSHVGSIVLSSTLDTEAKVIAIYGGTKWVKIEGRFLLGQSGSYPVNSTGGAATVTLAHVHTTADHILTVHEMPSHTHQLTFNATGSGGNADAIPHNVTAASLIGTDSKPVMYTGGNGAHNHGNTGSALSNISILPPYKVVYIWERTA